MLIHPSREKVNGGRRSGPMKGVLQCEKGVSAPPGPDTKKERLAAPLFRPVFPLEGPAVLDLAYWQARHSS